jgi:hypothetical protein
MHVNHKRFLAAGLAVAFIVGLGGMQAALAINPDDTGLGATAAAALGKANAGKSLPVLVGQIINTVLQLVGVILVALFVYGGFIWMTAQGEPDKVKKAKAVVSNAVVGMVIVFSAYSIANYVFTNVYKATMTSEGYSAETNACLEACKSGDITVDSSMGITCEESCMGMKGK